MNTSACIAFVMRSHSRWGQDMWTKLLWRRMCSIAYQHFVKFRTTSSMKSHYLYTKIEDVKNEDLLRWWHEHRHVFPHLYRMALDYHTIPCKFLFLYIFFFTHVWY